MTDLPIGCCTRLLARVLSALLLLAMGGCGNSDSAKSSASAPVVGNEAGTSGRATAGAGASGGAGAAGRASRPRAGSGGVRAAIPRPAADAATPGLTCKDEPCVSPDERIYPCCLADGSCGAGVNGECRALDQPGEASPGCASQSAWDGALELAGCCKADGQCGVLVDIGLGCIERSDLPSYLGGPLPRAACGAGAADADAGP